MTEQTIKNRLLPLTKFPEHFGYPPLGQLRALVFNAHKNGFDRCIRRIGRRILISVPDYEAWVDEQSKKQPMREAEPVVVPASIEPTPEQFTA